VNDARGIKAYEAAARNPALAAAAELRSRAEKSLIEFIRLAWPIVDPGNPLRVGWAMEAIAEHLEAVHTGQIRNLLINCPPGFSKSTLVNVFFPAWEWGPKRRPDLRYISWSYAEHLTLRDNAKCMKVIDSPLYQALWGGRFKWDPKKKSEEWYKNDAEGFRIASGVRGMGTGERGDRLVLDDPHSVQGALSEADRLYANNWFAGTLSSRVRNANPYEEMVDNVLVQPSSTIVIMQRVHHADIAGIILLEELGFEHLVIEMEYEGRSHPARSRESKKRPGKMVEPKSAIGYIDPREAWTSAAAAIVTVAQVRIGEAVAESDEQRWLAFELLWAKIGLDIAGLADPVRFSRIAVEELRERLLLTIGSNAVSAQMRQWPSEGSGDMFKPENWLYCDAKDVPHARVSHDVRGWDLAASENLKSDGTGAVLLRWGTDKKFYVMHAERVRESPGGVKDFRDRIRASDGPNVVQDFPQDPGQAGVDQVAGITQEDPRVVTRSSPETGSKTTRAMPMSGWQEKHLVVIVRGGWNREYVTELAEFPNSKFSALVDGSSRAFNRLAAMPPMQVPGGSEIIGAGTRREQMAASLAGPRAKNPNPAVSPEVEDDFDYDD
jgi:predicted phage terminase large subunit-like protein